MDKILVKVTKWGEGKRVALDPVHGPAVKIREGMVLEMDPRIAYDCVAARIVELIDPEPKPEPEPKEEPKKVEETPKKKAPKKAKS